MIVRCFQRLLFNRISLLLLLLCFMAMYLYLNFSPYRADLPTPQPARNGRGVPKLEDRIQTSYTFPKIVHQMWQSATLPLGSDMTRWKTGCEEVNKDWEFRFLYDEDLKNFVQKEYPQYMSLFKILTGVYMADMARILLVYHYGGLYLDVDFFCHRPFDCLIHQILANELSHYKGKDLLVVSREPTMHEHLFRKKDRVIIQDFFLATPKHPFFKWILDDRMKALEKDDELLVKLGLRKRVDVGFRKQGNENIYNNTRFSIKSAGPFSYSIEKDVDRYRAYVIKNGYSNHSLNDLLDTQYFMTAGGIYELPSGVLHPLVDTTNGKLYSGCQNIMNRAAEVEKICEEVNHGHFFTPTPETIAVHMWTHVYLGWSFLRSSYLSSLYNHVEHVVPPTLECPKIKKEYFPHAEGVHW